MASMGHLGGYLPVAFRRLGLGARGAELVVEHVNAAREHCFIDF